MDGVITNTMPVHFRAWRKIFREEGLQVNDCEIYMREGQPGIVTVKEIFQARGRPFDKLQAEEILARKERLFKKIVKRRFIPGAFAFLHFIKNKDLTLALVTGTARHEVRRIMPKKLLDLFSVVVTGGDVKRGKPHPEPYLLALKKLKLKPKEAVVIENAPFGIYSAKQAKLKCLALQTSLPKTYLKEADLVFGSFSQLRRKVDFTNHSAF